MKIVCFGYRDWSFRIFQALTEHYNGSHEFVLLTSKAQVNATILDALKPDMIFFIGWSWIISESIINKYNCYCLHPSPLPKYRGGSPIQNQIIAGEKSSAVAIFKMNQELDAGPLAFIKEFSLDGYLNDVFNRVVDLGIEGFKRLIDRSVSNSLVLNEQNDKDATFCKRRSPSDSQITIELLKQNEANYFYNLVRCLQPPYPRSFILCGGNTKLFLDKVSLEGQ